MPTVLHVSQPTDSGVATYVTELCADQAGRGWGVVVACPDRGRLAADLRRLGIPRMAWEARRQPGAHVLPEWLELHQILGRISPDVLHVHSSKAGMAGRLAAHGQLPTLFQPHGWSWLAAQRGLVGAALAWERAAARWTTMFVCVGEGEARQGRDHGLRGRYAVARNGVDLEKFQPAGERDRLSARDRVGIPRDVPLAVCVGRVTRQKGQDVLLAAWPAVSARRPDARLAILGGGELGGQLRRLASSGVILAGAVDDVRPWYAAADVVVLPSRWEGLPLTLLEALAVGCPVVGSNIPGIAEELPAGAGALVPAGDTAALAEAVGYRLCRRDAARAEGAVGAWYAAATADVRRTHEVLAGVTAHVGGWAP